ncbi:MAG: heme exporter protein CcmB [Proteobacteria bacterium]|nr:heme exporter protein CcmB [Pseudomonadota bacterium]TDI60633.1 MAG: heme exporter protein CcmB [Alphaproteobacteria bacterium]
MSRFTLIVARDLRLALRRGADSTMVVTFFILIAVLFPLGVGPDTAILARISPGVIWVTALLASMLSLEHLFQADFEDGSLDLLVLGSLPLEAVVLAKSLAHWLTTGMLLIVAAPVLALLLNMSAEGLIALVLAMLLGTPSLTLIGAVGAALTVGARRGGALLSLLVLPLYVPVLIFGVGAVDAAISGMAVRPHFLILGALLAGTLVLTPLAGAAALRQAVQ